MTALAETYRVTIPADMVVVVRTGALGEMQASAEKLSHACEARAEGGDAADAERWGPEQERVARYGALVDRLDTAVGPLAWSGDAGALDALSKAVQAAIEDTCAGIAEAADCTSPNSPDVAEIVTLAAVLDGLATLQRMAEPVQARGETDR